MLLLAFLLLVFSFPSASLFLLYICLFVLYIPLSPSNYVYILHHFLSFQFTSGWAVQNLSLIPEDKNNKKN